MKTQLVIALATILFSGVGCQLSVSQIDPSESTNEINILQVSEDGTSSIDNTALENIIVNEGRNLSMEEAQGLQYMHEEEKLAHDVYTALYEKYGVQAFSNIARSEQTHTEAVKRLLDTYNIEDIALEEAGKFSNQTLQKLYDTLMEQASISVEEALKVGAMVEEVDIIDLQKEAALTDKEDIRTVYSNLERGSRNHLRAFVRQLSQRGVDYAPTYLSVEAYESIISTETERGTGGNGNGHGKRQGRNQ